MPPLRNAESAPVSIDLKHLRYAEAAERCGSFRKAADSLSLKQSNLSRRIRDLEEQLMCQLQTHATQQVGDERPAKQAAETHPSTLLTNGRSARCLRSWIAMI